MNDLENAKRLFFEGLAFLDSRNYDAAVQRFTETLNFAPGSGPALNNLAIAQFKKNNIQDAALTSIKVIQLDPDNVEAYGMLANCQLRQKAYAEALVTCEKIIAIDPANAEGHCNRGFIFKQNGDFEEALSCFDRAIAIDPSLYDAHLNRANTLRSLNRYDEALAANEIALGLHADFAESWVGRGNILSDLKRYDEALDAYDKAWALNSEFGSLRATRLHTKLQLCDWSNFAAEFDALTSSIKKGIPAASPLAFISISSSAADQLQCARLWTKDNHPALAPRDDKSPRSTHDRIRVAYVSTDFRPHPVSQLMVGLIEEHNKNKFQLFGISLQPASGEVGQRLKQAFETFIDVSRTADEEVVRLMRELEIDIAVDLNGYTGPCRPDIFARRPAPIQVNYLGYPGTMGAEYFDYLIADKTLIPESHQRHYAEKIIYLPNTYQVNDQKRLISRATFSRAEFGLPEKGFVFCCFNNNYKILPGVFACWMRILKSVPDSVLWLLENSKRAAENLQREAAVRGVNPNRLVFAGRMQLPEHLARHRLADLFLDTLPYNAHTTTSDALWAGLPVLTHIGETFAGRVAASLLNAIGLSELIVPTQELYENRAVELAGNPERLAALKVKLLRMRETAPLFDTRQFARHIEAAYAAIHDRYQDNLAPDHISVAQ